MAESRLQRWARKKAEASKPGIQEAESTTPEPQVEAGQPTEEQELALNNTLTEQEILTKYGLPDPDAIELGTDITGFMKKQIPEFLRRRALRSLWKSNPVLAVLDGLNDYDEDFTNAGAAANSVKTLYKVGQGFDRKKKVAAPAEEPLEKAVEQQPEAPESPAPEEKTEAIAETSENEIPADTFEHQNKRLDDEATVAGSDREPEPRYRPRMRFDT